MNSNSTTAVILALETCTNICSVALYDGEKYYSQVLETARSHSKALLPMVETILKTAGLSMQDIELIACARGPGSFTGVRIGIGVAKGLAYGQDIPIIPVSPLQALAYRMLQAEPQTTSIMALLDARMGEVYAGRYQVINGMPILQGQEILTTAEKLATDECLFGGTGSVEYRDVLAAKGAVFSDVVFPLATDILALAQTANIAAVNAADFAPIYLRDKVTD